jgi:hypothetical protein
MMRFSKIAHFLLMELSFPAPTSPFAEKKYKYSAGFTSWKEVFLVEESWESLPHEPITLATQVKRGGELKSNRSLSKMEKNGYTKLPSSRSSSPAKYTRAVHT